MNGGLWLELSMVAGGCAYVSNLCFLEQSGSFQDSTLVAVRGNNFLSAKGPTDVASLEKYHD